MWISDKVEKTFNWLDSERAARIAEICKRHGAKTSRLAQKRGALGVCKIRAVFSLHSWAASNEAYSKAKAEIESAGLIDSLTFQNS